MNDPYGIAFKNGVVSAGATEGIDIFSAPFEYQSSSDASAIGAMDSIIEQGEKRYLAKVNVIISFIPTEF